MASPLPEVGRVTEQVIAAVRKRQSIVVEGPVGSGRSMLVSSLEAAVPNAVVVDLLPLTEADAPAAALLQAASGVPDAAERKRLLALSGDMGVAARAVGQQLCSSDRVLLLRVPETWRACSEQARDDDSVVQRAAAMLQAWASSGVNIVAIVDLGTKPHHLGLAGVGALALRGHAVPLGDVAPSGWAAFTVHAANLSAVVGRDVLCSPLAWRLAVGAIALGHDVPQVAHVVKGAAALNPLVELLAAGLASRNRAHLRAAVKGFLEVRRPIPVEAVREITGLSDEWLPLVTHCIGYGEQHVRITASVRSLLRRTLPPKPVEDANLALARHYESVDGVDEPHALAGAKLAAWTEKVHHLGRAGERGETTWSRQRLPAPEMYWDKARYLSKDLRDFPAAAAVYRACIEAFPRDDYGWHYYAYNLHKALGPRVETEAAFRRAVELTQDNPWWNGRLVAFLVNDGQPLAARTAWRDALRHVDPDGTQVANDPWLAENLHFPVAQAWLASGRAARATDILAQVPHYVLSQSGDLRGLARRVAAASPLEGNEDPRWVSFLKEAEKRCGVERTLASRAIRLWATLRRQGGPYLPIPMADAAEDATRIRFSWSYRHLAVDVDVDHEGRLEWYGRDRLSGQSEASSDPERGVSGGLLAWLTRLADA